jgi:hypothetical protein
MLDTWWTDLLVDSPYQKRLLEQTENLATIVSQIFWKAGVSKGPGNIIAQ